MTTSPILKLIILIAILNISAVFSKVDSDWILNESANEPDKEIKKTDKLIKVGNFYRQRNPKINSEVFIKDEKTLIIKGFPNATLPNVFFVAGPSFAPLPSVGKVTIHKSHGEQLFGNRNLDLVWIWIWAGWH